MPGTKAAPNSLPKIHCPMQMRIFSACMIILFLINTYCKYCKKIAARILSTFNINIPDVVDVSCSYSLSWLAL